MKAKKPNAEFVWKQLEDLLAPRLCLSVIDHTLYSYLLRHSRLEGRLRLRFSIPRLARGTRLSDSATRNAVRRLLAHGALRLVERSKAGHLVEVRLPDEIPGAPQPVLRHLPRPANLDETDFLQTKKLRQVIHARERGLCFTACVGSLAACAASTMSYRACSSDAIPTATSSPPASNATLRKGKLPPPIFSAASTASAASPPPNSPPASAPSTPSPPASSVLSWLRSPSQRPSRR